MSPMWQRNPLTHLRTPGTSCQPGRALADQEATWELITHLDDEALGRMVTGGYVWMIVSLAERPARREEIWALIERLARHGLWMRRLGRIPAVGLPGRAGIRARPHRRPRPCPARAVPSPASGLPALADPGYDSAGIGIHIPIKQPADGQELSGLDYPPYAAFDYHLLYSAHRLPIGPATEAYSSHSEQVTVSRRPWYTSSRWRSGRGHGAVGIPAMLTGTPNSSATSRRS